jgi:hypothetical protein
MCFVSGFKWSESRSGKNYPQEKEIKINIFHIVEQQDFCLESVGLVPLLELGSHSWRP